ncbi:MAG TPA: SHOCT domain-containing protein [Nitrospirae bacterium]|nr:SHOCT domain-containing protein [Nitrospirota bacterium]
MQYTEAAMHGRAWSDIVYDFGVGCGWLGPFLTLLLWALAVAGAVFIIRWLISGRRADDGGPLDLLKARYARGEIDREEFMRRKADLGY